MPKVSVIIPNYNHAPYLRQRIDSVLAQTYQDFELIILDDLSPDNSREIIEEYRSSPKVSHIVFNEVNSGSPFKQWQKGIELAKGEYIWMAESDDWCEPSLLQTLVAGASSLSNCTIAYCQSVSVQNTNVILRFSPANLLELTVDGLDYINKYLINKCYINNASMALFKREAYFKVSKDFTTFRLCGDWLFWSEMASQGQVFISGKLLNYFRFHDKDVSTNMFKTGRSFIEQFRCLLLMKTKFAIADDVYKKSLSAYYSLYKSVKKEIAADVINEIELVLNQPQNKMFKSFMEKQWLLHSSKTSLKGIAKKLIRL